MAYVETFIKRWDRLPEKEWDKCEYNELKKGDIIRIFERHTTKGRWFVKQVGGMQIFMLLADAKIGETLIGAWLNSVAFDFIKEGVTKNEEKE